MSLFEVKYTKKSSVSEHVSGIYKETSLYINGAMVYNKINTPLFIYKLPYNNLPLKEKYTGFNPIRLYEGRWVIGKIKDYGAHITTVRKSMSKFRSASLILSWGFFWLRQVLLRCSGG